MSASAIIFYILACFILVTGVLAVTSRKIFRSAIYLLGTLVGISGLYFWMEVEFIAAVQIVVYVGGIVVLIIFSIFLTQRAGEDLPQPQYRRVLFAGLATIFAFAATWVLIKRNGFYPVTAETNDLTVKKIGEYMLNYGDGGFVLPFEVVSMLLLAAMIGCIVIALKTPLQQKA